jgi:hypothetical protein
LKEAGVARIVIAVAVVLGLITLPGCSVKRVFNGPPPLDVEKVKVGESRQTIISVLGEPKSSEIRQDGKREQYEFVSGYPIGSKLLFSALYIYGDLATVGFGELYFDPHEKETGGGTPGRAVVDYGMDDLAKSILITKADGKPWEYPGQKYVEPPPEHMLAKLPPPRLEPPRVMPADGKIALIITGNEKPELEIPESSVFSAAGKGAKSGALYGAGAGAICYYGMIICSPVLGAAGGIIGSFVGPSFSEDSSTWVAVDEAYASTMAGIDDKAQLAKDIVLFAGQRGYNVILPNRKSGHEKMASTLYSELAKDGVSGMLDIDSLTVAFEPVNRNPEQVPKEFKPLRRVTPRARVRLVGARNGNVLFEKDVTDNSGTTRSIEDWLADDAKLLRREVADAVPRLAKSVVSEIFELQPIETRKVNVGFYSFVIDGLKPIYPEFKPKFERELPEASPVPTLRWEAFPGKNVTYDLRIWRAANFLSPLNISNGELVCEQENLLEPSYTVEEPLGSSRVYVWSVRAHFDVDGIRKVTQWSRMSVKFSLLAKIGTYGVMALPPDPMTDKYYMFRTGSGN